MAKKKKKTYRPVEPVNKKMFIRLKLSIDPKDIPNNKKDKSAIQEKIEEIEKKRIKAAKDAEKAIDDSETVPEIEGIK